MLQHYDLVKLVVLWSLFSPRCNKPQVLRLTLQPYNFRKLRTLKDSSSFSIPRYSCALHIPDNSSHEVAAAIAVATPPLELTLIWCKFRFNEPFVSQSPHALFQHTGTKQEGQRVTSSGKRFHESPLKNLMAARWRVRKDSCLYQYVRAGYRYYRTIQTILSQ